MHRDEIVTASKLVTESPKKEDKTTCYRAKKNSTYTIVFVMNLTYADLRMTFSALVLDEYFE